MTMEEKETTAQDILVNQLSKSSLEGTPRKGNRRYCELITKKQGGEPFIRKTVVHGHPYWQRCQYVYQDGKRKLKVQEHLGNRKPRS